jgi:hypothetical protein
VGRLRSGKLLSKVLIYESRGAGENRIEKEKNFAKFPFQVSLCFFCASFYSCEGKQGETFYFPINNFSFYLKRKICVQRMGNLCGEIFRTFFIQFGADW